MNYSKDKLNIVVTPNSNKMKLLDSFNNEKELLNIKLMRRNVIQRKQCKEDEFAIDIFSAEHCMQQIQFLSYTEFQKELYYRQRMNLHLDHKGLCKLQQLWAQSFQHQFWQGKREQQHILSYTDEKQKSKQNNSKKRKKNIVGEETGQRGRDRGNAVNKKRGKTVRRNALYDDANYCNSIEIVINKDNSITVKFTNK